MKRETPAFPPLRPFGGSPRTKFATFGSHNSFIGASDTDKLSRPPKRSEEFRNMTPGGDP
jgi:hypothetical protein